MRDQAGRNGERGEARAEPKHRESQLKGGSGKNGKEETEG